MAQWTDIDPNTLLPGDPWTSAKAQAAFENLEAVAEGAPGAPKVQGVGLGQVFLGLVNTTGSSAMGFSDAERVEGIACFGAKTGSVATHIRFSDDNGSSWGSWQTVAPSGEASVVDMSIFVDFRRDRYRATVRSQGFSGSLTIPSGMNAFQIRNNGGTSLALTVFAVGSE